jgi:CHAT domain-containing protein
VTNTSDRLGDIDQSQVLGLGLSNPVAGFSPLPAVDVELDAIIRSDESDALGIYPGQIFLNDAFTFDALKTNVRNHRVLHLATHAAFVPGRADESFIVLGNGDRLTAGDIEDISARLDNLHLVILSACETALGGATGDGTEITGISSYFLGANDSRAEAVIASLWKVSDGGTQVLMNEFYSALQQGTTKAEALQAAQQALIAGEFSAVGNTRGEDGSIVAVSTATGLPASVGNNLDHPYYWAPFILIGNGL